MTAPRPHVYPRGTKAAAQEHALRVYLLVLFLASTGACALSAALTRAAIP